MRNPKTGWITVLLGYSVSPLVAPWQLREVRTPEGTGGSTVHQKETLTLENQLPALVAPCKTREKQKCGGLWDLHAKINTSWIRAQMSLCMERCKHTCVGRSDGGRRGQRGGDQLWQSSQGCFLQESQNLRKPHWNVHLKRKYVSRSSGSLVLLHSAVSGGCNITHH